MLTCADDGRQRHQSRPHGIQSNRTCQHIGFDDLPVAALHSFPPALMMASKWQGLIWLHAACRMFEASKFGASSRLESCLFVLIRLASETEDACSVVRRGKMTITADSDNDGQGSFSLSAGSVLTSNSHDIQVSTMLPAFS